MISIESRGEFRQTENFLTRIIRGDLSKKLAQFGQEGVSALSQATPLDSGMTASKWGYEIVKTNRSCSIIWTNDNVVDGVPIAVLIQYGHGTRSGGYIYGRDYINPAIRPVFDKIAETLWKEVTTQ